MHRCRLYRIDGEIAVITQAPSIRVLRNFTFPRISRAIRPWALVACVMLTICSGCTSIGDYVRNGFKVGPNYQKPPAPVASEWIDSKSKGVSTAAADLRDWWRAFNDPKLNDL